ncbi:MAG: hypothetical protein JW795_23450 [Chitinivibrionales bacterium]|nr:hypothetical protein [Chitinivibrionales bacterium]
MGRLGVIFFLIVFFLPSRKEAATGTSYHDAFFLHDKNSEQVTINRTFTGPDELTATTITLTNRSPLFGAAICADVTLSTEVSLARVVLIDDQANEYLIYEVSSLLAENNSVSVCDAAEETKLLNAVIPVSLRIELLDATLSISTLQCVPSTSYSTEEIASVQQQLRLEQERAKIDLLNTRLTEKKMLWKAGQTSLSSLTYAQKKIMFDDNGMVANLQGFEYYTDGVFELKSNKPEIATPQKASAVVESFDWRNRHGANDPKSPYYDGDELGGGWATSIKDQALPQYCGSCWSHSTCANAEFVVNLYYNKHIDMDLSEQEIMECSNAAGTSGKGCSGGWPEKASAWVVSHGLLEEECYKYTASDAPTCSDTCKSPKENLRFPATIAVSGRIGEDSLKKLIIHHGPVNVTVTSMRHAMCLIGFTKTSAKTVWIFKNSHGIKTGKNGYTEVTPSNLSDFSTVNTFKTPVISKQYTDKDIVCLDKDKDGYYNWGLSPTKPATCPESPAEKDCDDSRNDQGPMQADGSCKSIPTGISVNTLLNRQIIHSCSPNPFSSFAIINFAIPQNASGTVQIFDLHGTLIKTVHRRSSQDGMQQVLWNGTSEKGVQVGNGTYLCRIILDNAPVQSSHSFKIFVSR